MDATSDLYTCDKQPIKVSASKDIEFYYQVVVLAKLKVSDGGSYFVILDVML